MELTLKRIFKGPKYTIGHLFINGVYECDTLEPPYMGTKQTDSTIVRDIYSTPWN